MNTFLEETAGLPRIDRDVAAAMKAAAKADRRTLRAVIEIACEEWLDSRESPAKRHHLAR